MKRIEQVYGTRIMFWVVLLMLSISVSAQEGLLQKLKGLAAVGEVRALENSAFSEKYVMYFNQPLDHQHPEKGTFLQRVVVGHVGEDRPTVVVTEGYGGAYALNPKYREEISRLLNANMVFVEHRYFLESTPQPKDWAYLTAENSADDLHAITTALKTIYPAKWVSTGISKGGQTSLLYRMFYPNDVEVSVPYVAPLCYAREDGRHEPFIQQVSTKENRAKVEAFQLALLKRKAKLMPLFEGYCTEKGYQFQAPLGEIFDYCVLEYSFAFWQWGTPIADIPAETASDEVLFNHLLAIAEPSYFQKDSPTLSFFVQAARELGYYGYDVKPFEKYLSIKSTHGYLNRLMLPEELREMPFDSRLSQRIVAFLKSSDPRMIFIYGQNDPWTSAGVTWLEGKKNIKVFIQPNGSHLARIKTLPKGDQEVVIELLKKWLE